MARPRKCKSPPRRRLQEMKRGYPQNVAVATVVDKTMSKGRGICTATDCARTVGLNTKATPSTTPATNAARTERRLRRMEKRSCRMNDEKIADARNDTTNDTAFTSGSATTTTTTTTAVRATITTAALLELDDRPGTTKTTTATTTGATTTTVVLTQEEIEREQNVTSTAKSVDSDAAGAGVVLTGGLIVKNSTSNTAAVAPTSTATTTTTTAWWKEEDDYTRRRNRERRDEYWKRQHEQHEMEVATRAANKKKRNDMGVDLTCQCCLGILKSSVTCVPCGHVFCELCLDKVGNTLCPSCRAEVKYLMPCRIIDNVVDALVSDDHEFFTFNDVFDKEAKTDYKKLKSEREKNFDDKPRKGRPPLLNGYYCSCCVSYFECQE